MKDLKATVIENKTIAENIYLMTVKTSEAVEGIRGGTFLNISVGDGEKLLRRPFGIMKAEKDKVTFCYQIKGDGTSSLSKRKAGDELKVLLPLGNGFDLKSYKRIAVVGGGVGIFPLIAAVQDYKNKDFYCFLGFRNKNAVCLLDEFKSAKSVTVVTDDGSFGGKGNAVSAFFDNAPKVDAIISCGPLVMLKALKQGLVERGIKTPCFVSLEERMGCGIGACLVCVCKTSSGENKRVCHDGPVFDISEVEL